MRKNKLTTGEESRIAELSLKIQKGKLFFFPLTGLSYPRNQSRFQQLRVLGGKYAFLTPSNRVTNTSVLACYMEILQAWYLLSSAEHLRTVPGCTDNGFGIN